MTSRVALLLMAWGALLASPVASGQTTTATLSGVIRDASGAVVPEARIGVTNINTGATREGATDGEGRYNLTNLGPGQYEVRAERAGFRTAQSNLTLTIGGAAILDLTLQIGNFSEVVEVKQEEPLIEPTKAEMSRVVNQQAIESLPIIGRNFVDFAKLSSGVAPGRENTGGGAFKEPDTGVRSAAAPRLTFGGQSERRDVRDREAFLAGIQHSQQLCLLQDYQQCGVSGQSGGPARRPRHRFGARGLAPERAAPVHPDLRQQDPVGREGPARLQVQFAAHRSKWQAFQRLRRLGRERRRQPALRPSGQPGPEHARRTWFRHLRYAGRAGARFNEKVSAEFSVDFFNLFNRTNITDLNTVYGSPSLSAAPNPILGFGTPRDAANPFQVQYGMKLRF